MDSVRYMVTIIRNIIIEMVSFYISLNDVYSPALNGGGVTARILFYKAIL